MPKKGETVYHYDKYTSECVVCGVEFQHRYRIRKTCDNTCRKKLSRGVRLVPRFDPPTWC